MVDLDLEKFFDRVNHDKLISLVKERVKDRRVLHLIELYLKAGALTGDGFEATTEGTPEGVPYTPYKVANPLLEFSASIPRTQLRPSYGDGFLGAPLQVGTPCDHPMPAGQGDDGGPSKHQQTQLREIRVTFEPSRLSRVLVAQAYAQVVPILRRMTSRPASSDRSMPQEVPGAWSPGASSAG